MPTRLKRLTVLKDQKIAEALDVACLDTELAKLPEAARIRELALRGAEALAAYRDAPLEAAYAAAWEEWDASEDAALWDRAQGDE